MILSEKLKLHIKKLFFVIISVLVFFGCDDKITQVGEDLLNDDKLEIISLDSRVDNINQYSMQMNQVLALGNASSVILGKDTYLESKVLLNFAINLTTSEVTAVDSIRILSAYVTLVRNYSFGDSNGVFNFNTHSITSDWNPLTITSDSLSKLNYSSQTFSSDLRVEDSLVTFALDTSLVKQWFRAEVDTANYKNYGVILIPTVNTNRFIGFYTYGSGSTVAKIEVVKQKLGGNPDTVTYSAYSDVHIVTGNTPNYGSEKSVIQNGLTTGIKVVFTPENIPSDAALNIGTISVTVDTLLSEPASSLPDYIFANFLKDSSDIKFDDIYSIRLTREGNVYKGNAVAVVNKWHRDKTYYGVYLTSSSPIEGLSRLVVYNSNAVDSLLRPRLQLTYSRKK